MQSGSTTKIFTHFHLFCGLGGGAKGANRGRARVGNMEARFECIGGIDSDAAAIRDFERLSGAKGTCRDLFSREQYTAFHGTEPPNEWREAVPDDLRVAAGGRRPNVLILSAPCKGFSGLLSETISLSAKYQALNGLTLRGIWLALEAWKDDPAELLIFENVPRIATRGRKLLDQIVALLRAYGYAVAETTHDCGELGGLAQSRKRFLLVARHAVKVPPFLYEPPKRSLRGVGEVLERLPFPTGEAVLPMHRMPSLQWRTWVRLAFVEAGSDWRSLNKLRVQDGILSDFAIAPDVDWNGGVLGVKSWQEPSGVVTGRGSPTTGTFAVADPRVDGHEKSVQLGVRPWDQPAGVVTGKMFAGGGPHSVADPRLEGKPRFNNTFRIVSWAHSSPAVAGPGGPAGGLAVADPRAGDMASADRPGYGVTGWEEPSATITSQRAPGQGKFSVADPRSTCLKPGREAYLTGGHYGVVPWRAASGAVTANGQHDNGKWSVADPRAAGDLVGPDIATLPEPADRLVAVIRALDGTCHRPFTTLELAALQSLIDPEEVIELDGLSDSAWRERIGNAIPPDAMTAIMSVMGRTLLLAALGETFMLSAEPIWVTPVAVGLMAATVDDAEQVVREGGRVAA